jgi:hypothetical protein
MAISLSEASATVVYAIVAGHKDNAPATKFLQSFFPANFNRSHGVKFNIQRSGRPVAVDVTNFSNGEYYKNTLSDQKLYKPPYYKGNVLLNDHELYLNTVAMIATMNAGSLSPEMSNLLTANLQAFTREKGELLAKAQDAQYRAIELQAAKALRTGIITLANADNIDFKRKADSIVDLTSTTGYWTTNTVSPFTTLETMCRFIRKEGMSGATRFNALFGVGALNAMKNNTIFKERMDLNNFNSGTIQAPSRPQEGAEYHGQLNCGPYIVDVWTYDQYYDDPSTGTTTSYLDSTEVIVIAPDANFSTEFCLVEQVIRENGTIPQTSEFLIQQFINEEQGYDKITIKSAPVVMMKSIDKVATAKVIA